MNRETFIGIAIGAGPPSALPYGVKSVPPHADAALPGGSPVKWAALVHYVPYLDSAYDVTSFHYGGAVELSFADLDAAAKFFSHLREATGEVERGELIRRGSDCRVTVDSFNREETP